MNTATNSLVGFLKIEQTRSFYGRVTLDNVGSRKLLEKCAFVKKGTEKDFANPKQIKNPTR